MDPLFDGLFFSDASAKTIRVGSAGLSGEFLPLWVANDRGIFKKYGFDTEIITFQGDPSPSKRWSAGQCSFMLAAQVLSLTLKCRELRRLH